MLQEIKCIPNETSDKKNPYLVLRILRTLIISLESFSIQCDITTGLFTFFFAIKPISVSFTSSVTELPTLPRRRIKGKAQNISLARSYDHWKVTNICNVFRNDLVFGVFKVIT